MPCYYTGSAEGDRALAWEESAKENAETITKLTQLLCEACTELYKVDGLSRSYNLSKDLDKWWKEHQRVDKKNKTKRRKKNG